MNSNECFIVALNGDFTKQNNFINGWKWGKKWSKDMNKLLVKEKKQKRKYIVTSNQKCK